MTAKITGPWGIAEYERDHPPHLCYALLRVERSGGWTPVAVFVEQAQAVAAQWSHWSHKSFLDECTHIVVPASREPVGLGVAREGPVPDFIDGPG